MVVEPTGLHELVPIVLLSDLTQDKGKLIEIQQVEKMVIPEWDLGIYPSFFSHIVVGGSSEFFIGNQGKLQIKKHWDGQGGLWQRRLDNISKSDKGTWTAVPLHHPYSWEWGVN